MLGVAFLYVENWSDDEEFERLSIQGGKLQAVYSSLKSLNYRMEVALQGGPSVPAQLCDVCTTESTR